MQNKRPFRAKLDPSGPRDAHPLGRYSSLGIMQPKTVEKFSVGQRFGLDLAD